MATTTQTLSIEQLQIDDNLTSLDASTAISSSENVVQASLLADASVPDGGYGWVMIFGCSVIAWWFIGTTYSWGVIQAALISKNPQWSPSTLSWIGSLTVACNAMLAVVSARIIRLLGARYTGVLGMTLFGVGQFLSSFCTKSIVGLFITTGVVTGFGTSLSFMVVSSTPAQYFSKKRGVANGIVYAGGGLGGTVISFAMDGLIERLGVAWTLRVLGLIILATGIPAAWLVKERAPLKNVAFIDWRLLRDFRFNIIFLAGALGTFPLLVPPFFLPLYANSLGLSSSAGAGLVAGFNFSSALGRLGCGFLSDSIGPINTLFLSFVLSAGSMLVLWPVSSTIGPLIAFVIINGAANGGFFSTMPTVVGNVFGSARVSVAMGMVVTGWTGGYLLGAPIAGYLLDAYGGENSTLKAYLPAILFSGSMASVAAGLVGLVRLKMNKKLSKKL